MKWSERSDVRRSICLLVNVCSSFQFYVYDRNKVRAISGRVQLLLPIKQRAATAVTVKLYWIRRIDLEEGEGLQHSSLDVKTTSVKWVFTQATSSSWNIANCWHVDVAVDVTCEHQLKSSPCHRTRTVYFKSRESSIISQDCSSVTAAQWNFYFKSRTAAVSNHPSR